MSYVAAKFGKESCVTCICRALLVVTRVNLAPYIPASHHTRAGCKTQSLEAFK